MKYLGVFLMLPLAMVFIIAFSYSIIVDPLARIAYLLLGLAVVGAIIFANNS